MDLEFLETEIIPYEEALQLQLKTLDAVRAGAAKDTIIFTRHPSIVTLGSKTEPGDVYGWTGPTLEVARGGRATYHGPGQIVIYPILNLNHTNSFFPYHDVVFVLRWLEQIISRTLQKVGIEGESRSSKQPFDPADTGVWVNGKKVASLGIGVKSWTSYHGAAINFDQDPLAFSGINPCGFQNTTMTSVQEILGHQIDRNKFIASIRSEIASIFNQK